MAKVTGKRSSVIVDDIFQDSLNQILKTVAPNAQSIMTEELTRIEKEARKEWPRRKDKIKRDRDGNILSSEKTTLESFKKFRIATSVSTDGTFNVYLKNTAPYSYVIRFGIDSENSQKKDIIRPQGASVANELMVKPHRKTANKVTKALAEDLMKRV